MIDLGEFQAELKALQGEKVEEFKAWFAKFPSMPMPTDSKGWEELDIKDAAYKTSDFDDTKWGTVSLPGLFEDFGGTRNDGAFWFRKKVDIQDISSDYTFVIDGGIDDLDATFVNGQQVGFTFCWNCPREYVIPKSILVQGENTFAIRAIDTGGPGGLRGEMSLTNSAGKTVPIAGEWRYTHVADIYSSKLLLYQENLEAYQNPPEGIESFSLESGTPSVLYNGMIQPMIPYQIKGAIWYQGESNVGRDKQYEKLFPGMIEDWRARWNNDFSFYFVQIAPFTYGNELSPALRDAQRKSLKTSKTGMAITMDIGHPTSIHPGNKQDVGDRLARLALANDYGHSIVASGPLYKDSSISGNKMILAFDYTGTGLMSKEASLTGFEIAGTDKKYTPATAKIVGDKIEVFAAGVSSPAYVRYAWKDYIAGSLFNEEGLPASSFSTED